MKVPSPPGSGKGYHSLTRNRGIYLQQALLSSKLLRWLDAHVEELTEALQELDTRHE